MQRWQGDQLREHEHNDLAFESQQRQDIFSTPKHPDQLCNLSSLVLDGYEKSLLRAKAAWSCG
jgi:hypothetical protein